MRDAVRRGVDSLLEFTVAGSFSRIGPVIRRYVFDWQPIDGQSVRGQVAVVTGATSGLGLECATALARMGARVILLVRNSELGAQVSAQISASTGNDDVAIIVADLSDLDSVRGAAAELRRLPAVHILVHNAGAMSKDFNVTAQGIERTAAAQLVGPFLLTSLIRDQLQSGWARIVWVTSGGMYTEPLDVDWLEAPERDYDGVRAYAKVKRAQVSLNAAWAPRFKALGVTMTAMHPGWVNTPGLRQSLPSFARLMRPFLRLPAQGVDTILWLVTTPSDLTRPGTLWLDRRSRGLHRLRRTLRSDNEEERVRLLNFCLERSGLEVGPGPTQ
ncbi:MAG TPA: SDR family NAD(P)-dependent oxidoreductase [Acidimicrobiales bacterium]